MVQRRLLAAKQPPATRRYRRAACRYRCAARANREHIGGRTVATGASRITQEVARAAYIISAAMLCPALFAGSPPTSSVGAAYAVRSLLLESPDYATGLVCSCGARVPCALTAIAT